MKLAKHDNSLETNAEVESQDFGIGDVSVVIEMLRKHLYEYRIRTLVQEYMCNGRDATREAKSSKRVIVSIPNSLSPVFKVRDFGPGITPERMANVFTKYGASTKRGTNGQTGGFGIGAKSAWSYTDSFTIVSITGGMKRTYVAHIGVNNQGRMDKLSEVATTEPNGTEIQVAVKPHDVQEFKNSVFRACYFWTDKEKPELKGITALDETPTYSPELLLKELELTSKSLPGFINYYTGNGGCLLVIDGIPYPISSDLVEKCPKLEELMSTLSGDAILHIGNGLVEVASSREKVADSEATREALNNLAQKLNEELKNHIKASFKACKTNADWINTYRELSVLANVDEHSKFQDYKINNQTIDSTLFKEFSLEHADLTHRRGKVSLVRDITRYIRLDQVGQVFVIDNDDSMIIQNKRIREFLEKTKKSSVILIKPQEKFEMVAQPQVTGKPMVPHAKKVLVSLAQSKKTFKKIVSDFGAKDLSTLPYTPVVRIPKAKRDRTKEMFTIHYFDSSGKHPDTTTIESVVSQKKEYVFASLKDCDKYRDEFMGLVDYMHQVNKKVCVLSEDSINMVANCANFVPYEKWKSDFKPSAKLLQQAKHAKAKNLSAIRLLKKADKPIKDKHLAKMLNEYALILNKEQEVPATIMKWVEDELKDFVEDDKELTRLINECYPLIETVTHNDYRVGTKQVNELVYYINAKQ